MNTPKKTQYELLEWTTWNNLDKFWSSDFWSVDDSGSLLDVELGLSHRYLYIHSAQNWTTLRLFPYSLGEVGCCWLIRLLLDWWMAILVNPRTIAVPAHVWMRCVVGAVLLLLQMVAERRGIIIHLLLLIYMFQLPPWYWQCFGCYIKYTLNQHNPLP